MSKREIVLRWKKALSLIDKRSLAEGIVFVLGLQELSSLPVYLLALGAAPELGDGTVGVGEVDFRSGFCGGDDEEFGVVALDAPGKSLVVVQVEGEHLLQLDEHAVAVVAFPQQVDGYVGVALQHEFAVAGHQDPSFFFRLAHCELVVLDSDVFSVDPAVSHYRAKFLQHVINQEDWFLSIILKFLEVELSLFFFDLTLLYCFLLSSGFFLDLHLNLFFPFLAAQLPQLVINLHAY